MKLALCLWKATAESRGGAWAAAVADDRDRPCRCRPLSLLFLEGSIRKCCEKSSQIEGRPNSIGNHEITEDQRDTTLLQALRPRSKSCPHVGAGRASHQFTCAPRGNARTLAPVTCDATFEQRNSRQLSRRLKARRALRSRGRICELHAPAIA